MSTKKNDTADGTPFEIPKTVEITNISLQRITVTLPVDGVSTSRHLLPTESCIYPYYNYIVQDLRPYLDKNLVNFK